ncbi:MAG TPA: DUF2157 domain-containing protein, partial [Dongiaceae bacterium]|nr:DUF2157 domain-containing protein [Dongiaceae bacterium]
QFLAGVVFFFAYNWNDLSDIAKFAVVEGAVTVAALGALAVGLDRAFGQVLLVAASVLTGVLLAVIGQVYQTGADMFELFLVWAVLILPWTLISRSAVQWLLWLVVAEVALWLYCEQVPMVVGEMSWDELFVLGGASIALALVARELAVRMGCAWLGAHWTRLALLFAVALILFMPAAGEVLDIDTVAAPLLCVGAFIVLLLVGGVIYWRKLPDFAALVILIAFADAFFICLGYRLIDEAIGFSWSEAGAGLGSLGAMILWAIAGTGGSAMAMRRLRSDLRAAGAS